MLLSHLLPKPVYEIKKKLVTGRLAEKVAPVIVIGAIAFYIIYLIRFLTDPWSSWVHVESAYGDVVLKNVLATPHWANYLHVILGGAGIDDNPARLRFVNNAVELFDSYSRKEMVAIFGFLPSLANASSVIYFIFCPLIAFVAARRLVGTTLIASIAVILSLGLLLTSVGYVSASIFIFHPAKKIVIAGTLIEFVAFIDYMKTNRTLYVILIAAIQFSLALTDEVGLVSGLSLSSALVIYVILFRRQSALDLLWPAGFGVATLLAFAVRYWSHWDLVANQNLPELHRTFGESLLSVWPAEGLKVLAAHLAGAFSVLYGSAATKFILLVGFALAAVIAIVSIPLDTQRRMHLQETASVGNDDLTQSVFWFGAASTLLALNATAAVLLLRFGGAKFLSELNYYYASVLPVFSFVLVCSAFRLTELAMQERSLLLKLFGGSAYLSLAVALGLAIAGNVKDMPRVNRLVGMMHNNPYEYGAINQSGGEALRAMSDAAAPPPTTIRVPQCGEASMTRRFQVLLDQLGLPDGDIRRNFMYFPSHPFVDEKYLHAFIGMMLRSPPAIEAAPAGDDDCYVP